MVISIGLGRRKVRKNRLSADLLIPDSLPTDLLIL
jgi:hypothetical protein